MGQYLSHTYPYSQFIPLIGTESTTDEGSSEVLLKKFKRLEEELRKANDSNKTLMTEIKSLKRKKAPPSHHDESDDPNSGEEEVESDADSDHTHQSNEPAMFSSQQVFTQC